MSNYFQVLKRIENARAGRPETVPDAAPPEQAPIAPVDDTPARSLRALIATPPAPPAAPVAPPPAPAPLHPSSPLVSVRATARHDPAPIRPALPPTPRAPRPPAPPLRDEAHRGIATLFDNIRALASGRATRTLVFSGAAVSDSAYAVTEGLARHAERHGMQVLLAELTYTESGATLVARTGTDDTSDTLTIDLNAGAAPGELNAWLNRIAGASDLVLLEAPPLAESIDAALLACACDGLVIVADAEVTPRAALQTAAERAQISGCRTLGVVMSGTKQRMPSWMRRLIGGDGHPGGAA